ncbi:cysteine-rich secretory protein 3-like [Lineus longissimus]|uniref:cysteine-rich secretory protein 3-like n=1 Tax=Lineus longissimus TaxID=88925 RepID=UPI00315CB115
MITGQRASTGDTGSKSKDISDHYTDLLCHESSKMIPWLKGFLLVACVFAKAQATCEPKFSAGMPNKPSAAISSACLEATGTGSVSDADKKVIVEEHNRYRKNASPKPGNMQYMVWDDELASVAQGWTSTCPSGHDTGPERYIPGRGWSGQNMFSGTSGDYTWSDAIKYWHSEVKDFVYGDESSIGGRDTGHYTQIVWASSAKIGCGFAKCSGTDNFICNYMHAQGG